jgi:Fungal fucose-specific lectin
MTTQDIGRSRTGAAVPRAGSSLACFGVGGSATRLYFIGIHNELDVLAKTANGWDAGTLDILAAPNSPLTCFGFEGNEPRVYFIDPDSRIIEMALKAGQWTLQTLPGQPAPDSPLTCLGLNGTSTRLYYIGTDRQVHQLAADRNGNFKNETIGVQVAPGSGLTCHPENQANVFYVSSTDNLIHVLTFENPDDPDILDFAMDGTHPVPGSALTCFALPGGIGTRLYYLDDQYRVNEMAWTDDTMVNHPLPAAALPSSALTCFGVGGQYTRLYYLDHQAQVNELGWSHGSWTNKPLPGTAAPDSDLTCFGVNGTSTRLYYLDAQSRINELAWQTNRFVNSVP